MPVGMRWNRVGLVRLRAQRLPSGPDQQLPALGADHGRHVRPLQGVLVEGTRLAKGAPEDLYDKVVIPSNSPAPAPPTCPP